MKLQIKQFIIFAFAMFVLYVVSEANESSLVNEAGTQENPHIVPLTKSKIDIDGKLEEKAWQHALIFDLPYETWPRENIEAPVQTEALLLYSHSHLYVGFKANDPNPSEIRAHYVDRDHIWDEDYVVIYIDTFNDERRAFSFRSNPLGVQGDDIQLANDESVSWDAIYESEGNLTNSGYTVEMAIPFNQLRFQRTNGSQVWGVNVRRLYPRNVQSHIDAIPLDRNNDSEIAQFIKIRGFEGATPGKNVEIVPTLVSARTDERSDLPDGDFKTLNEDIEAGLSARWGLTTNLTLNSMVNPDFSQVEADALQLDINEPFALHYDEKRPFFTEGSDYFSTLKNVVYTRMMREPTWGIKLSGKETGNTIGAYIARDDVTNIIFPGNESSNSTSLKMNNTSAVFRYKRDIGKNYTFGLMATDREGHQYFNRLTGFDANMRITKSDRIQLQVLGSSTQYPNETAENFNQKKNKFNDHFIAFEYDHYTRNWGWWLDYDDVGPGFRADLGYIPMVGFRNIEGGMNYRVLGESNDWWNYFDFSNELNYYEDDKGGLLEKNASLRVNYAGIMRSHSHFQANRLQQVYDGKKFDLTNFSSCFGFWPVNNVWFHIYTYLGDRIDYANTRIGKRFRLGPSLILNLGKHLQFDFDHTYEKMKVHDKRLYTAHISSLTAVYHFNVRTFFRGIFHYVNYDYNPANYTKDQDAEYKHFFTQLLFSYKMNPFTVFFIGYSDNYLGNQNYELTQSDRTVFMKLSYAWVL